MRKWLQTSFIGAFLNVNEASLIRKTKIHTDKNPRHPRESGPDCEDFVFLPDHHEVSEKIIPLGLQCAAPSQYAKSNRVFIDKINGYSGWWIRTNGNTYGQSVVRSDGTLNPNGVFYNERDLGIRPMMWLSFGEHANPSDQCKKQK